MVRPALGLPERLRQQLASADLDLAYGGLPALWSEPCRAPPDQPPFSPHQHAAALSAPAAINGFLVAQRFRRRPFCLAPPPRRIRRLGLRAQGCPQHLLLPVDDLGVCALCGRRRAEIRNPKAEAGRRKGECRMQNAECRNPQPATRNTPHAPRITLLHPFPLPLRPGADVQTNARHAALCLAAARLLAAPTPATSYASKFKV